MAELLRMPEVAAGTSEAVLAAWPLAVDAEYRARDTIAVVETAKAAVDVEAERAGVLLATLVAPGTEVAVGAPIALIGAPGERVGDLAATLAALGAGTPGTPASPPAAASPAAGPAGARSVDGRDPGPRIFASPLARRLARAAGLDVNSLVGSGPNGRIVRRDVEEEVHRREHANDAAGAVVREHANDAAGAVEVPHTRLRRAVAARLSASKQQAPHFYVRGTARMDALLRLRDEINEVAPQRVSINDFVVKAVALAHVRVPELNVVWGADAVRRFETVDVSVAVATDDGLVTPVLRAVQSSGLGAIAARSRELGERARRGELRQRELEGGTITVTNLGMFGTEEFTAIINPPQAAILAVGAVRQEPVVADGRVEVASVMRVVLSVDHRPVDGVTAARWMAVFLDLLGRPAHLIV